MKSRKNPESGMTLMISLLALAVVSILSVSVYRSVQALVRESVFQNLMTQARCAAEAGLEDALLELRFDGTWRTGFTQKASGDGAYTVTLSTGSNPQITSIGYSSLMAGMGRTTVAVTGVAQFDGTTSTGSACTSLFASQVNVNGKIDAYDSNSTTTPGSFTTGGRLCTNYKIVVETGSGYRVRGDVEYYSGSAPESSTVEGLIIKSTFTRTLPLRDGTPYVNTNDNGRLPTAYYTSSNKRLTVSSNKVAHIFPGTYYLNQLNLSGELRANTSTGTIHIYLNSNLSLSNLSGTGNGEITNTTKIPSRLRIYPQGNRSVTHSAKAPLYAVIEGRQASIAINKPFYGNLMGYSLTIGSGGTWHFDQSTVDVSSESITHVSIIPGSWSERY